MQEQELLRKVTNYFHENIFSNHRVKALGDNAKLKSYKINPITVKYLSKVLEDNLTPIGIAKALYLPRVTGTSMTTIFGNGLQKMFIVLELAEGSLIPEMDIEFIDKLDNRKKWCQLKSGPNTINSGDVQPLIRKFNKVANLGRTNYKNLSNSDLILGVLYGKEAQLSQHYKNIDKIYPVIIGQEFWHRLTGFPDFYDKLVKELDKSIIEMKTDEFFQQGYMALAKEIESSDLFDFE